MRGSIPRPRVQNFRVAGQTGILAIVASPDAQKGWRRKPAPKIHGVGPQAGFWGS